MRINKHAPWHVVSLRVNSSLLSYIDQVAEQTEISRSDVIRISLIHALDLDACGDDLNTPAHYTETPPYYSRALRAIQAILTEKAEV